MDALQVNTRSFLRSPRAKELLLGVILLLSRLPFIFNGLGTDLDSAYEVYSGKCIAESGVYNTSRLPGYPLTEFTYALLNNAPFWVLNLLNVLFTVGACLLFYRILIRLKISHSFLLAAALGFIPVVYVNSTVSISYNWSLFFILAAIQAILSKNYLFSSVLFGLVVSSRFNNLIYFPALFYLVFVISEKNYRLLFLYSLWCGLFAVLFFLPVILRYKLTFLFPASISVAYAHESVLSILTMHTFGLLGVFVLVVSSAIQLYNWYRDKKIAPAYISLLTTTEFLYFNMLMVGITLLFFVKYPFETGYLIPMLPFLLLLTGAFFKKNLVILVSVSLIISPFFLYASSKSFRLQGIIFMNEYLENQTEDYLYEVRKRINSLPAGSVVCVADYLDVFLVAQTEKIIRPESIVRYINSEDLEKYRRLKRRIYYIGLTNEINKEIVKTDLSRDGEVLYKDLVLIR